MKYSPSAFGLGQLSGSSGGTTASHNRFGSYFRARTIPVNPRTPIQTLRRELLAGLSADWRTLTQPQRTDWDALAMQISKTDSLGNTYNPTGQQTYVGNNSLRVFAGTATVDAAPALDSPPILTSWAPTMTITAGVVTSMSAIFTPTPLGAGNRIAIYATGVISPGRSYIKPSEYRLLTVTAANATSPQNILALYDAIYGDVMAVGEIVYFKAVPISANFFRGTPVEARVEAA
jgi:hypothetical protein